MSLLVNKAFETEGLVKDYDTVMEASNSYRKEQDYVEEFISDRIMKCENGRLSKNELSQEFALWYKTSHGGGKNTPNKKKFIHILKNIS
jgi:phage/plasmid-associated DNA primase